jgi:serine/threonine protein kinase
LLDDITIVKGKAVTYEKRYTRKNTISIADSDFPGIPRIDYYALNHGRWSDCSPIEFGRGTDQDTVFKLAAWKTKSVHHDATFLSRLINNDNIVRLICIVTMEGRFAGYGMERLEEYHFLASPMKEQVKKVLPAFIQETVEYLHQTAEIYHCDIRLGNIMVNGEGRLKLIDFDVAQANVLATPHTALPESQFFLDISPRLDHLDISMSVLLMFTVLSDMPEEYESRILENPLKPFNFYLNNNLKRSDYFDDVQNRVQRKLRTHVESPDGRL